MKELIQQELDKESQPRLKKLILTEFLQHLILQSLYRNNAFKNLIFTGGTALRILYNTGRFSEDLDFSLESKEKIKLQPILSKVQNDLKLQGLNLEIYPKQEKTVLKADFRFPNLLQELNLSQIKDQKLTVKFEVDQNPPKGGEKEILLITSPVSYSVSVYTLSSLFATKLQAIFLRKYVKGRDYYDLAWYLGKKIKPDFKLLNNAFKQVKNSFKKITEINFKENLEEHLDTVDFKTIRKDIERFILNQEELSLLKPGAIKTLLRNY
ncbi:MAG: nucleotidyl transferase AbiEii/AbiGii toxin family protein [Candidatus Melainabacteria bacterium]|nr:nucleotidyl transferase AbiEii/AbiGii toxin family protein [Candidatus Melainabacteria bacterium]